MDGSGDVRRPVAGVDGGLNLDNRPAFFKIIFAGLTTEHLRIPPHFMKNISEDITRIAVLKVPSGGHWHIKLEKREGGMFLQDGWQEFLKDNSLGNNEFLVFRYNGDMCFDVKIFDKSGCERVVVPEICEESAFPTGKRKRGRPRKCPTPIIDQQLPYNKLKRFEGFKAKDVQMKIKIEETDFPNLETRSQLKRGTKRELKKLPTQRTSKIRRSFPRKKLPAEVSTATWKRVESFTSKFPHFSICMKDYNVNRVFILHVPTVFSNMHLPRSSSKIVLQNSEGKSWVVNSNPTSSKTHAFCGGWNRFVHANMLKQYDICIFELVQENTLQVHIFRAVIEIDNATRQNNV